MYFRFDQSDHVLSVRMRTEQDEGDKQVCKIYMCRIVVCCVHTHNIQHSNTCIKCMQVYTDIDRHAYTICMYLLNPIHAYCIHIRNTYIFTVAAKGNGTIKGLRNSRTNLINLNHPKSRVF